MLGFSVSVMSGDILTPFILGFLVVTSFLLLAYAHKIKKSGYAGMTSEMSALTTYLIGGLVQHNLMWIATTLVVVTMLLLSLKNFLEGFARKINPIDILSFTEFLLLSVVILPLLPNEPLTQFLINPFKIWIIVVAISGVSYASYVLQKIVKGPSGILWAAILGGVYSSTLTTVALSRRSNSLDSPHLFTGGILMASGVMYLRILVLLAMFNRELLIQLAIPSLCLSTTAIFAGYLWSQQNGKSSIDFIENSQVRNPLEIHTAFIFGSLFIIMMIATKFAADHFGNNGIYTLAGIMGLMDVDPFIMSLTQTSSNFGSINIVANAVFIAASSNNLLKGIYAFSLSSEKSRFQTLLSMLLLSVIGLIPIFLRS
jgi:uncharacterized membrane protein (DUF4010 family)